MKEDVGRLAHRAESAESKLKCMYAVPISQSRSQSFLCVKYSSFRSFGHRRALAGPLLGRDLGHDCAMAEPRQGSRGRAVAGPWLGHGPTLARLHMTGRPLQGHGITAGPWPGHGPPMAHDHELTKQCNPLCSVPISIGGRKTRRRGIDYLIHCRCAVYRLAEAVSRRTPYH